MKKWHLGVVAIIAIGGIYLYMKSRQKEPQLGEEYLPAPVSWPEYRPAAKSRYPIPGAGGGTGLQPFSLTGLGGTH